MNSKLFIPTKIKVGYQNRKDTYTKKLAYVIYYDQKNILRKETSWNSWRDKQIETNDFDNTPTSGFVLNKKVGDYHGDWFRHRHAHVRVYDPRDFEFEITVENLLFILQECSSVKGKGLEGDFVYAWDGKELVLLPASSKDYQESIKYTNIQSHKIAKSDITEGCVYIIKKDLERVLYLGRHDIYRWVYNTETHIAEHKNLGKKHIFKILGKNHTSSYYNGSMFYNSRYSEHTYEYLLEDSFSKISHREDDTIHESFANSYEDITKSLLCSPIERLELIKIDDPSKYQEKLDHRSQTVFKFLNDNELKLYSYMSDCRNKTMYISKPYDEISTIKIIDNTKLEYTKTSRNYNYWHSQQDITVITSNLYNLYYMMAVNKYGIKTNIDSGDFI
jgi:hypothetical protein